MTTPNPFDKVTQETIKIGSKQFLSNKWPTRSVAFRNLPIIGRTFAVPISVLYGGGGTAESLGMATQLFFDKLSEPEADQLIELILADVTIKKDGGYSPVNLDSDLDDIDELCELLAAVLKQQYGKLISGKGSRNLFGVMVPLTEAPTK